MEAWKRTRDWHWEDGQLEFMLPYLPGGDHHGWIFICSAIVQLSWWRYHFGTCRWVTCRFLWFQSRSGILSDKIHASLTMSLSVIATWARHQWFLEGLCMLHGALSWLCGGVWDFLMVGDHITHQWLCRENSAHHWYFVISGNIHVQRYFCWSFWSCRCCCSTSRNREIRCEYLKWTYLGIEQ